MSDFAGELCVLGGALISPLATTPAAHAFFARAGATPAAGALDGPLQGTFACASLPDDAALSIRLSLLTAQAVVSLLADLPEGLLSRTDIEVVVSMPGEEQGIRDEDVWFVERSVQTALSGTRARLTPMSERPRGPKAYLDEILRAGRDLSQDAIRLLVAVDSPAHPKHAAKRREGLDSPWDPAPPRRSEAAAGLVVATAARAARDRLPIWGRLRGGVTRAHDSTPDNDVPSDGSALTEAIRALPGRSVFSMVVGPEPLSGFHRRELFLAIARDFERFESAYHALRPTALLGDVGLASLPAGIVLGLSAIRHNTLDDTEEARGKALVWDLFPDGTRAALGLTASFDSPPAHRAARELGPMRPVTASAQRKRSLRTDLQETEQGCLERLLALSRLRKEAPWRELPDIERRILANLDALAETPANAHEAALFFGRRGDPAGGFAATLALGALGAPESEGAEILEEATLALFGPEGATLLDTKAQTLDALWWMAEGICLFPSVLKDSILRGWINAEPPTIAALALVALAQRGAPVADLAASRLRAREPLFLAATARGASSSPDLASLSSRWRDLLEHPGPLAWEGARALLLSGDETPLLRVRAEDEFVGRLDEQALLLLALAGRMEDAPLFGRLIRKLGGGATTLFATGYFGALSLTGLLLSALEEEATADAAASALETMLGSATTPEGRISRAAWSRAVEQASWAAGARARDGAPWSLERLARPVDPSKLSDRDWQFRIDEIGLVTRGPSRLRPGGFGRAARESMLAALDTGKRGSL